MFTPNDRCKYAYWALYSTMGAFRRARGTLVWNGVRHPMELLFYTSHVNRGQVSGIIIIITHLCTLLTIRFFLSYTLNSRLAAKTKVPSSKPKRRANHDECDIYIWIAIWVKGTWRRKKRVNSSWEFMIFSRDGADSLAYTYIYTNGCIPDSSNASDVMWWYVHISSASDRYLYCAVMDGHLREELIPDGETMPERARWMQYGAFYVQIRYTLCVLCGAAPLDGGSGTRMY